MKPEEKIERAYEELRAIIDGGSESFTHDDAVAYLKDKLSPRTWVGLESEEIRKAKHHMVDGAYHYSFKQGAEWAEEQLKKKNT